MSSQEYGLEDVAVSRFLKKTDFPKPTIVTIKGVDKQNVAMPNKPAQQKVVLYFAEFEKPLVLNRINFETIINITGSAKTGGWIGKKVVLFNDMNVTFAGVSNGGIRVRAPKVKPAVAAPVAPAAEVEEVEAPVAAATETEEDLFEV